MKKALNIVQAASQVLEGATWIPHDLECQCTCTNEQSEYTPGCKGQSCYVPKLAMQQLREALKQARSAHCYPKRFSY